MARNTHTLLSAQNLRALVTASILGLVATAAAAEDHLAHLRMMLANASAHGAVIPQPEAVIRPDAAKTFNIVATANPWRFTITPSPFVVSAGDVVTINISVPAGDQSESGHGILMESYIENGQNVGKGQTRAITFTATTAGTFAFVCTQSSCGTGHSSMFGTMIVNAAPSGPTIASVSPTSGPTSGGTAITITGTGFQTGATVTIGGAAAQDVVVSSATTITAKTPLGPATEQAPVARDVVVRNPDGTSVTSANAFSYTVPPLAVTTITPLTAAPVGGAVVTIIGAGFTTAVTSSVTFGGVAATNVTVIDAVTMRVVAPAHALGPVDVVVRVGTSSVTKSFTYQAPPPRRRSARH